MLGLTSYQEALRGVGRIVGHVAELRIVEHASEGWLEVATPARTLEIDAAQLEDIVMASVAQRGEHRAAGETSDLLRAIGLALDEVHALGVQIVLSRDGLTVHYADRDARQRELMYGADELDNLRRSAAARRNGQPLRRVLILQAPLDTVAGIAEVLVAEFAIQVLPMTYARAIAATAEPPDLIIAQTGNGTADAIAKLRAGVRTGAVPLLVIGREIPDAQLFALGADDVLQEAVQPAQLRARIRTLLLRGRGHGAEVG
jgi:PleD family two-component response regulator